jgi:hypothetical protein
MEKNSSLDIKRRSVPTLSGFSSMIKGMKN